MTSPIDPLRPTLGPATWSGRLVAGFYDLFILLAIWLIVSNLIQFIFGEAQANLMQAALLFVAWLFFGHLWTKTGRTLGMQAWHLRLESQDGRLMTWKQATARFAWVTLFVGGFYLGLILLSVGNAVLGGSLLVAGLAAQLSAIGQPDRRTWWDRFSGTRLVAVAKVKSQ